MSVNNARWVAWRQQGGNTQGVSTKSVSTQGVSAQGLNAYVMDGYCRAIFDPNRKRYFL